MHVRHFPPRYWCSQSDINCVQLLLLLLLLLLLPPPPLRSYYCHFDCGADESTTHSVLSARQPPLLLLRTDTYHGTGCTWGSRSESTYADNAFVQCSYTSQALKQPSCIPGAHPANICPGSGVVCPECGKSACLCPAESLPAGAYVSLEDADRDYFSNSSINDDGVLAYESFRATLLLFDTTEHERRGLTFRRLTKLTQPWVTENPLFFHLSNTSSAGIRQAVDDAVEVGIEMVVQSFGTSWKMEDSDKTYLAAMKREIDYAHSHGIECASSGLCVLVSRYEYCFCTGTRLI